ncbi:MAG TPA: multiubiquitin domain-containing protein [Methylophilaceae bacterium]|nr:multiubiquitin domain-containing protein [Methylophilaceae bacterium]
MATEHANEKNDKSFDIVVNGTQERWTDHRITYEQVVQLAFPGEPQEFLYTVTYANVHGKDGSLAAGQDTNVKDGMVFNVGKTNRS